ncbi:MAG: hypothetical protein ACRDTG_00215 [Pseudonocardiaceae bacterium]
MAISLLSVAVVAGTILANVPEYSAIGRTYEPVMRTFGRITGLEQGWGVFAPDPRVHTFEVYATVEFDDGSTARWQPPAGDPFLSAYRIYRWRKWVEYARSDDGEATLWLPTAVFIARQADGGGRRPVHVSLVRRWRETPTLGTPWAEPGWKEFTYFSLDVTRDRLR